MDNRIKLAEAMGWKRGEVHTVAVMGAPISAQRWTDPDGNDRAPSSLPDPFTDANDCEALIRWLNENGYRVRIDHRRLSAQFVEIWRAGTTNWKFGRLYDAVEHNDWKTGVCKLALKVIE